MSQTSRSTLGPSDVVQLLRKYPRRWAVPAVSIGLLALVSAMMKPNVWRATQTLLVRDAAVNGDEAPGRFRDVEEMKVTQETVLEVAKSHRVLHQALVSVGHPSGKPVAGWPSRQDVAALRGAISLSSPSGTEYGKTEISYLKVESRQSERAVALAAAIAGELRRELGRIHDAKAQSMIDELTKTAALAAADMNGGNRRLREIEQRVGKDLNELRMMEISGSGDSDLRRRLNTIEDELREARVALRTSEELRRLLVAAEQNPGHLLATPHRLLQAQPSLRRLKEGLIDAQLNTAGLLGKLTALHPRAIAARRSEQEVAQHIHNELAVAVRGVEVDLRLTTDRVKSLAAERQDLTGRLNTLAALRSEYSAVVSEVNHRTQLREAATRRLAAARAAQASASTSSLLTFVDEPQLSDQPLGPSRTLMVLFGVAGGLITGLGVLLFTAPLPRSEPETVASPRLERTLDARPATTTQTAAAVPVHAGPVSPWGLSVEVGQGV